MHAEHSANLPNGFFPGIWHFGSVAVEAVFIFHSSPEMMDSCKVPLCVVQQKSGKDTVSSFPLSLFFSFLFFLYYNPAFLILPPAIL